MLADHRYLGHKVARMPNAHFKPAAEKRRLPATAIGKRCACARLPRDEKYENCDTRNCIKNEVIWNARPELLCKSIVGMCAMYRSTSMSDLVRKGGSSYIDIASFCCFAIVTNLFQLISTV